MNNEEIFRSYLRDSEYSLQEAKNALKEGVFHRAVRRSQESVELVIKGTLRLLGLDYPRKHEVGSLLETAVKNMSLPQEIASALPEIKKISAKLSLKRGPAFYGDEEALKTPEQLYTKKDAEEGIKDAEYTIKICKDIQTLWKKQLKLKTGKQA
ncbi:MAG: HEPN domain-containing protein [Candidatus Freyarchaeum deiterrae]